MVLLNEIKSLANLYTHIQNLIEKKLWLKVLVALALGIGVGLFLGQNYFDLSKTFNHNLGNWLGLPG
jgi:hypothetical protein